MADIRQKAVATASTYDQGNIAGLDDAMTRRLIASTVLTESHGGDLAVTNRQGYVGRYQAGAGWLADAGYVDADKLKASMSGYKSEWAWAQSGGMTKFLENPSNWNNGVTLEKYKASDDLQDRAFKINSDKTYQQAVKAGVLDADDSPEKVAGFLKARHISGYGGAVAAATGGRVSRDSNGTSNYDYMHDITRNRDGLNQYMSRGEKTQSPATVPSSTQAPSPMADGMLKQGEKGEDVRKLQEALNKNGAKLEADGNFGTATKAAVESYQRSHNLHADGVAGAKTLAALGMTAQQQTTQTDKPQTPANVPPTQTDKPQTPANVQPTQTDKPQTPPTSNDKVQPPTQNDKPLISNPSHPDNKLYQQALSNLEQLGSSGGFKSREELEKAAAAVAVDAKSTGLQSIDHISRTAAPSGQNFLVAVQGDPTSPAAKNSYIDYNQATSQTVDQSTKMAQQLQQTQNTQKPQSEEPPKLDNPSRGTFIA